MKKQLTTNKGNNFNMKKKMVIMLSLFLLVAIVTAGILTAHNPTINVEKDTKTQLDKMNLTDIQKTSCVQISDELCEFKMYSMMVREELDGDNKTIQIPYKHNLGSHRISLRYCNLFDGNKCLQYTNYNEVQLKTKIEIKIEEWLNDYIEVSKDREVRINDVKIIGGYITISDK